MMALRVMSCVGRWRVSSKIAPTSPIVWNTLASLSAPPSATVFPRRLFMRSFTSIYYAFLFTMVRWWPAPRGFEGAGWATLECLLIHYAGIVGVMKGKK
ncbi:uncharacterized protein LY79DRAFT_538694 [Colletotrichum navitas]|uniref:Uncharacterized protein n=1 Tax=Colletotrichum navitas TaxID=681940 RepID=A0AAD8Q9I5_9PEZI|nr:uncharacterized protein LY79DRAFT_538694 [Colletotrichum navitas]KAK1598285.1 hypothetical protein LY79DRAFT_538694 [Colletotrichum navitas]